MTTATRTDTQRAALHPADSHDLIRVYGARENNLKDIDVEILDGLTTAIIVDQERLGANPRSTVGTVTDANAMLRILFSRLGTPHIGSPQAFSFNVASISGAGAVTIERGGQKVKERREFSITGGMCPRCEGTGTVSDIDLSQLYDDSKSIVEGAFTIPGYKVDSWWTVGIFK